MGRTPDLCNDNCSNIQFWDPRVRRVVRGGGGGPVENYQHGQDLGKGGLFSLVKRRLRGIYQHPSAVTELVESGSSFPSVTAHRPRGHTMQLARFRSDIGKPFSHRVGAALGQVAQRGQGISLLGGF